MSRPTISCCVIAKNEENNVEQWYRSIEGCFDEVIFVDTGSTDRTVEIAKSLGLKVYHFDWVNDFAAARNFSFSHATSDYVFWNDLDDVLENKEEFIKFRDTIMSLADYWVATYHYASDAYGKAVISFVRERVMKRSKQFQWKYFVHEGVMPESPLGPVTTQFIGSWAVRHKRTESDMIKDRSRNLDMFKGRNNLDPRMQYYLGKELFESNKPVEAINQLLLAMNNKSLETHDRVLGIQYTAMAYMKCGRFDQAIEMAHLGLMLRPNRAEFNVLIADCLVKIGRPMEAVPHLAAAKASYREGVSPIFTQEDYYSRMPRQLLTHIYANIGDLERALSEAKDWDAIEKSPETKATLTEVERVIGLVNGYKSAKPCDDIAIIGTPQGAYEWDYDIAKTKAMGGSETGALEMAKWLNKLSGRKVKIFNMRTESKSFGDIEFIPASRATEWLAQHQPWLAINWRHNLKLTNAPTFVWSHDLTTPGVENTANYVKVLALTPFHREYLHLTQGVPYDKIHVTRNGLDPERFKGPRPTKDPFKFVFGSSPDRGLERCIRVLDKVREKYPQVTLHIHYGWDHLHKWGLKDMADKLQAMYEERKDWITYHGATQQDALMDSYKRSAYVIQPSDWIETSCISAMEFIACGVYPIFRKVGGVSDTLSEAERFGMATLVDSDCITETDYQKYVDATIQAIEQNAYQRVKFDAETVSWERVAKEWLEDLPKMAGYVPELEKTA